MGYTAGGLAVLALYLLSVRLVVIPWLRRRLRGRPWPPPPKSARLIGFAVFLLAVIAGGDVDKATGSQAAAVAATGMIIVTVGVSMSARQIARLPEPGTDTSETH